MHSPARAAQPAADPIEEPRSFTRGIFSGVVHDGLLFPFPPPLDERDAGEARVVRRLIADLRGLEGDVIDAARFDEEERVSEEAIRAAAEIGLLGLTIPQEFGGLGLSASAYARVFGEISRIDAAMAVLVGVHCGLGAKAIVLHGSREQKERYLPVLARGDTLAAYALTEPEIGSDAQNIRARAELSADGAHWQLTGRKIWIGNGHRAGVIVTFAQTRVDRPGSLDRSEKRRWRPSAFIIRPDMPGFRIVGTVRKLGIRGSTQAELAYEGLQVPADHLLGHRGKGFTVAVQVLNAGRFTLAAGCTAGTKHVLREMAAFAERREQFGRPIAGFEITQRKLARTAIDLYAADAMLGALAGLVDREGTDYSLEAACAKVFASDMLWRAADEAVQVAGGRGYVRPYPYERILRDARINRIFEGTNEILRLFIALNGIQTPASRLKELRGALKAPMRNLGLIGGYAASRVRGILRESATLDVTLHERLGGHKRYFEKHVAELKSGAERALTRHRREILERQMVLERLADMAIELFATASVIARTQMLLDRKGEAECGTELELCDLFCIESGKRFRALRLALDSDEDAGRRAAAATVRRTLGYAVADAILDVPDDERPPAPRRDAVDEG